jgi:hypothetical protein
MPTYLTQQKHANCGPLAIVNAYRWLGYPITRDFLNITERICDCGKGGTHQNDMKRGMDFLKLLYGMRKNAFSLCMSNPTINDLNQELAAGNAVLLSCYWFTAGDGEPWGHYVLLVGSTKHYYEVVNGNGTHKHPRKMSKEVIKRCLKENTPKPFWWVVRDGCRCKD